MEDLISLLEKESRDFDSDEKKAFDLAYRLLDYVPGQVETRFALPDERVSIGKTIEKSSLDQGFIGAKYSKLFPHVPLTMGAYKGTEDFLRTVAGGGSLEKRTMLSEIGVSGGFNVPGFLADQIWNLALEQSICLSRVRVFPMKGYALQIAAWDSGDHTSSGGPIGNFSVEWLGEGHTANKVKPKLRAIKLEAQKVAAFVDASRELIQDGQDMSNQIGFALKSALSYATDDVVVNGDGLGKPVGILNSESRIRVNRASANAISYVDLVNMIARMIPSLLPEAIWICSPAAYTQLLLLTDTVGNYIWTPGSFKGAGAAPPQAILGLPLFVSEKANNLGSEGDIILVALSAYAMGWREQIVLETSNIPGWSEDLVSFRVIARLDGRALLDSPVTPAYGGNTLSWAVTLI